MGLGIKKIAESRGHGNLRNLQTLQIAELFEYHTPSVEIRKTESTPSSELGLESMISSPSGLFCPTSSTLDFGSLLSMNLAQRMHFLHSSSKSNLGGVIFHLNKCYSWFKGIGNSCLPPNIFPLSCLVCFY